MKLYCPRRDQLVRQSYPVAAYERAYRLFQIEDYTGSISELEAGMVSGHVEAISKTVGAATVFELIGWNYYYLRDYRSLLEFFDGADAAELSDFPGLELLYSWARFLSGDADNALTNCNRFIAANSNPIHSRLGGYLFLKATILTETGSHREAAECGETAYQLLKLVGDDLNQHRCANYLGIIFRRLSDYRESMKWYLRALSYFETSEHQSRVSMVCLNVGVTYYKIGEYEKALNHINKSLSIGRDQNRVHRECMANIGLGAVYRLQRDFRSAREVLKIALEQAQEVGLAHEEALAIEFLGDVYRDEGAYRAARRFYERAYAISIEREPDSDIVRGVLRRIGECLTYEDEIGAAIESLNKSLAIARSQGDRFEEAITLRVMCESASSSGDLKTARKHIDQSIMLLDETGARHEHAISLLASVTLALQEVEDPRTATPRIVRLNRAWKQATRALDLFIKVDIPWWTSKARAVVARVSAMRNAQEKADKKAMSTGSAGGLGTYQPGDVIIHQSRIMRDVIQLCDMFATTEEPVLITGETGTGKEVVAKRLHAFSERAEQPLVVVNVAAIPETMFEREFFGHVKGAFSGATQNGEGFAARANGGTLFLDEIGDLPLDLQPKLLRLLQEKTYQALGDPMQRKTDIRLVAATNADLERKVQEGTFRADLYYRLRILDLQLPPVRDRSEDVLPLMRHFLCVAATRPVDLTEYFNRSSLETLESYEWPGNVREIAMIARQAHVSLKALGRVEVRIRRHEVPDLLLTGPGAVAEVNNVEEVEAQPVMVEKAPVLSKSETVERARILVALEESGENRNVAAKALGIGRSTLYRKMQKYGIPTRRT